MKTHRSASLLLAALLVCLFFSTPASAQDCGYSICTSTCMEWSPVFFVGGVPMTTLIFYPCNCHTVLCPGDRPDPPQKIIDLIMPRYFKNLDMLERAAVTPAPGCRMPTRL